MLSLLLPILAAAAPRCGPNRCQEGAVCGNDTCGICAFPGEGVIQPDCGWARDEVGGSIPLLPATSLRSFSMFDLDSRIQGGQVGSWNLAEWSTHARVPLAMSSVLLGTWTVDGQSREGVGTRRERLELGAVWTPPLGTRRAQGGLGAGIALDRTLETAGEGWFGPLGRATTSSPFRPAVWTGVTFARATPRWIWPPGVASLSFRVLAASKESTLDLGFVGTASISQNTWGNNPIGWMVGLETERFGNLGRLALPIGAYVLPARVLQLGVEGGPAWRVEGQEWRFGALLGLRIRAMASPERAETWIRRALDVLDGELEP